jgi:hypothetical protein
MKKTNEIKAALYGATVAVDALAAIGCIVTDVCLGNKHPVITIETPSADLTPKGAEVISIRSQGSDPVRIQAARYKGCLVTWKAAPAALSN